MTNNEFAKKDEKFKLACESVGLPFSKSTNGLSRQASKWRRKKGLAYKSEIIGLDMSAHVRRKK